MKQHRVPQTASFIAYNLLDCHACQLFLLHPGTQILKYYRVGAHQVHPLMCPSVHPFTYIANPTYSEYTTFHVGKGIAM